MVALNKVYLRVRGHLTQRCENLLVDVLDAPYDIPLARVYVVPSKFWKIEYVTVQADDIRLDSFGGFDEDSQPERVAFNIVEVSANEDCLILLAVVPDVSLFVSFSFFPDTPIHVTAGVDGYLALHCMSASGNLDVGLALELLKGSEVAVPD